MTIRKYVSWIPCFSSGLLVLLTIGVLTFFLKCRFVFFYFHLLVVHCDFNLPLPACLHLKPELLEVVNLPYLLLPHRLQALVEFRDARNHDVDYKKSAKLDRFKRV